MTNQARGRKISEFPADTTLPANTEISFVADGVNYRITLADFQASIGVTGTIVQDGDVTSVPILDVQGAINNIRNIEAGAGISASVSPENGVLIEHNFQSGTGGQPILTNPSAASPQIGNVIAGANISVAAVAGGVQVTASNSPIPATAVIVSSMSDFPEDVAGVITLPANTYYMLMADVSTVNRFDVSAGGISIQSINNAYPAKITYTGSGDMFTGSGVSFVLSNIRLSATSGQVFNMTDSTGLALFSLSNVVIDSCNKLGAIAGSSFGEIRISTLYANSVITDGFNFGSATVIKFSAKDIVATVASGVLFKLGTAVFNDFTLNRARVDLAVGVSLLSGAAASANISSGSLGTVINCKTTGSGTPLSTIAVTDNRWQFLANSKIQDTRPSGLISLNSNATATTISVSGTAVKANGNNAWVNKGTSQFTAAVDGKLTYTGEKAAIMSISITASISPSSGTKSVSGYIAVNGAIIAETKSTASDVSTITTIYNMIWNRTFATNDYIEFWVADNTDTTGVVVVDAVIRIA